MLTPNHYYLVIETQQPNLSGGMSWLQNTCTRWHHVRHRLWGHRFGGRYKAVVVDHQESLYLPTSASAACAGSVSRTTLKQATLN